MSLTVWHAIARRQSRYHALLIERWGGRALDLPHLAELCERFKRHSRRIDRHRERLLAILEPVSPAQH